MNLYFILSVVCFELEVKSVLIYGVTQNVVTHSNFAMK